MPVRRVSSDMIDSQTYQPSDVGRRMGYTLEKEGIAILGSRLCFPEPVSSLRGMLLGLAVGAFSDNNPFQDALDIMEGRITRIDVPEDAYIFFPHLEDQDPDMEELVKYGWLKPGLEDPQAPLLSDEELHVADQIHAFSRQMVRTLEGGNNEET